MTRRRLLDWFVLGTGSGWRLPSLDGLRGIAALSVFGSHIHQYAGWRFGAIDPWIAYGGQGGVVLFFALSGFLLYLPWVRAHVEGRPAPTFRVYALRRVLRIVPAYYVSVFVIAAVALAQGRRVGPLALVLHLLFVPLFASTTLLSVFWSLQVEEFFYWALPALHRLATRSRRRLVGLSCSVTASYSAAVLLAAPHRHWNVLLTQTPFYLMSFVIGMVAAQAWAAGKGVERCRAHLVVGVGGYLVVSQVAERLIVRWEDLPVVAFANLALAPFLTLVVLSVANGAARGLAALPLRLIGAISYSLYLWHLFLIKELSLPFAAALALPVAALSFLFVERPFLLLRPRDASVSDQTERSVVSPA